MTLLCIETSTAVCSAAICKDRKLLKQCISFEGGNHARLLPLYIEELLSFAREQQLTLDAVALSEGPGSYTGLRIGAAMAKGLCYGLGLPLVPVSTLQVLKEAGKEKLMHRPEGKNEAHGVLIPMIDARRMEVYTLGEDNQPQAVVVDNKESLMKSENGPVYYFGDGAAKCQKVLTDPDWYYLPDIVPEAQYVALTVENGTGANFLNAQSQDRIEKEVAYFEPNYLKEFQAAPSHVKGLK